MEWSPNIKCHYIFQSVWPQKEIHLMLSFFTRIPIIESQHYLPNFRWKLYTKKKAHEWVLSIPNTKEFGGETPICEKAGNNKCPHKVFD